MNPTDPKQKAFVEEVGKLHNQIRDGQFALRTHCSTSCCTPTCWRARSGAEPMADLYQLKRTPFHERTSRLCLPQNWRRWAGYIAAGSYDLGLDREYWAIVWGRLHPASGTISAANAHSATFIIVLPSGVT